MDLIYTNEARDDVGVLTGYTLDLAFGNEENDFEMEMSIHDEQISEGSYIYIEGTEYGGVIDGINVDTGNETVKYVGRSFHGILNSKIICPDSGAAYYTVSGEANEVLAEIITRIGLTGLFTAGTNDSGITISAYSMDRYIRAYDGINKMLKSVGAKLNISFKNGAIQLAAKPIVDYAQDEQYSSDHYKFNIVRYTNKVNHLVCLGKGELADRQVIHLYVQEDGSISTTNQAYTGTEEYAGVYDYSSVESIDELEKQGKERLKELNNNNSASLELIDNETVLDINDIVGATEEISHTTITNRVVKKIIKIKDNMVTIDYKVGD